MAFNLLTIASTCPRTFSLSLDGSNHLLSHALNITVGKNPYLAGGIKLSLDVKPDDGRLYLFAICGVSRIGLLGAMPKLYSGSIADDSRYLNKSCMSLTINSPDKRVRVEFDGDPDGWCPTKIDVMPKAIRLIGAKG